MAKTHKQTVHHREHAGGKKAHEKMFNIRAMREKQMKTPPVGRAG